MEVKNLAEIVERVNTCGCGDPSSPLRIIREVLEHMPLYEPENRVWLRKEPHEQWKVFALHVLTSWQLLIHGGTIEGSWLTDDGTLLLQFLQLINCDHDLWKAFDTAALNESAPADIDLQWLKEAEKRWNW